MKNEKKEEKLKETEKLMKNCYVRIKDQDYALKAIKIMKNDTHTIIYWNTKDGKEKRSTILNTEVLQIDEDI